MTDPYQVLGISPSATDDEVKTAYRKMAKLYHPDRNNGSEEAEKKMMQVNEAYAQIMDMRKNGGRASYQQSGPQGGYYNPFGGFGYQQGWGGYQQGAPEFATVRQYLAFGRYMEALQLLNRMNMHTAEWHYLCARARQGLGDDIAALNYARQAVNMEPDNAEYQRFLQELTSGGQAYRQQSVRFGGIHQICQNPFCTCVLLNMCCGGGCGGLRCCFI